MGGWEGGREVDEAEKEEIQKSEKSREDGRKRQNRKKKRQVGPGVWPVLNGQGQHHFYCSLLTSFLSVVRPQNPEIKTVA